MVKHQSKPHKAEESAFKPDIFHQFKEAGRAKRNEEAAKKGIHPEDAALYEMSTTDGWGILKEYISSLKTSLEQMVEQAMISGTNFEEIGKIALLTKLTSEKLDQVIQRVEGSQEVYEQSEGRTE